MTPLEKYNKFCLISKPPVVEAIIDIVTNEILKDELDGLDLSGITGQFNTSEIIQSFQGDVRLDTLTGEQHAAMKSSFVGYMHKTDTRRDVVQTRVNGFGYNVLKPYSDWDSFVSQALEFWEFYRSARAHTSITRLGLRYINVIQQPTSITSPSRIFDSVIGPFDTLFGDVRNMNLSYAITKPESLTDISVNIFQQAPGPKQASFVLDIDVVQPISISADDVAGLRETLSLMRDIKNEVFFGSLSEKQLETFV